MDGRAFLREVATLIDCGWCRCADARDRRRFPVAASDPSATAWSLTGALAAVSDLPESDMTALRSALWGISAVIPDSSLDDWNNAAGRTQSETLQMLVKAETSLSENPAPDKGWSLDA